MKIVNTLIRKVTENEIKMFKCDHCKFSSEDENACKDHESKHIPCRNMSRGKIYRLESIEDMNFVLEHDFSVSNYNLQYYKTDFKGPEHYVFTYDEEHDHVIIPLSRFIEILKEERDDLQDSLNEILKVLAAYVRVEELNL